MIFKADTTERIDKFLAAQSGFSRGRVQTAIKSGQVSVNGKIVGEPDLRLSAGDEISMPDLQEPDQLQPLQYDLRIVFENDDIAVIDKPASLVVHPGAGHKQDTLSNALLARYPEIGGVGDPARPGIVHRLDEDTSGLIAAAKTPAGYDYMKSLFLTRKIDKQYITLVHGIPEKLHDVINVPIGRSSTHLKMKAGIGRESVTEYAVLATNQPPPAGVDEMALLKVKLHTGRTHQIRVHMAHIGHPVVGDQLYGGRFKKPDAQLINRQFLHASGLKFSLADGTLLELSSELPQELKSVLRKVNINYAGI